MEFSSQLNVILNDITFGDNHQIVGTFKYENLRNFANDIDIKEYVEIPESVKEEDILTYIIHVLKQIYKKIIKSKYLKFIELKYAFNKEFQKLLDQLLSNKPLTEWKRLYETDFIHDEIYKQYYHIYKKSLFTTINDNEYNSMYKIIFKIASYRCYNKLDIFLLNLEGKSLKTIKFDTICKYNGYYMEVTNNLVFKQGEKIFNIESIKDTVKGMKHLIKYYSDDNNSEEYNMIKASKRLFSYLHRKEKLNEKNNKTIELLTVLLTSNIAEINLLYNRMKLYESLGKDASEIKSKTLKIINESNLSDYLTNNFNQDVLNIINTEALEYLIENKII